MPKREIGAAAPESRKRSRRTQGLPPSMDTAEDPKPCIDIKLPTEVKTAVLELLEKADLKQARLVSSSWYPLATRLLFDRVYISPKSLDIEVFMECVRHPIIKESIKEIIYDTTIFELGLTTQQYCVNLVSELMGIFLRRPIQNPTHPFHHFMMQSISDDCDFSKLYQEYKNETFIVEGRLVWLQHAWDGVLNMENGLFADTLRRGLRAFNKLRSILVKDGLFGTNLSETEWMDRSTLRCKYSGSPVTRSWNPLHGRPSDNIPENIDDHFRKLTSALADSGTEIKSLRLFDGQHEYSSLPVSTLQSAVCGSTLLYDSVQAYSNLETFVFRLDSCNLDRGDYDKEEVLGMLPSLLAEMVNLKNLELDLGKPASGTLEYYWTYKQVFPSLYYLWPNMVSLAISGLSIRAIDLLNLLFTKAPGIRKLQLSFIDLLSGTWEGGHRRPIRKQEA